MSAYQDNTSSFKNKIINGGLRIWQRGTSVAGTATTTPANLYQADRFYTFYTGLTAGTVTTYSKGSMSINSTTKITARLTKNATAVTTPTGGNYHQGFVYTLEDYDTLDLNGQKMTLSFWFNVSVAGTYSVGIRNLSSATYFVSNFTMVATTATKIIKTFTIPTTYTTATPSGAKGFEIVIGGYNGTAGSFVTGTLDAFTSGNAFTSTTSTNWLSATSLDYIEIAQVQLEQGDTATDFESRPYQVELAMCQRYYEKSFPPNTTPALNLGDHRLGVMTIWSAGAGANSNAIPFKVTKRLSSGTGGTVWPAIAGATAGQFSIFNNTGAWGHWNGKIADCTESRLILEGNGVTITNVTSNMSYIISAHWTYDVDF